MKYDLTLSKIRNTQFSKLYNDFIAGNTLKLTCAVAMGMAVASVNSTCFFTAYQPDVPEDLK